MSSNPGQNNDPDVLSLYNKEMWSTWNLVKSLRAGTNAMRAQGQTFLPKEPKEKLAKYKSRLARTFLFNAYDEAIKTVSKKPFSKEVVIDGDEEGDKGEFISRIKYDVDKEGRSITQFAHDIYESAVDMGMVSILVDFSNITDEQGNPLKLSLQRERDLDVRPCFVQVPRDAILGFREDPEQAGRLTQIRILEEKSEPDGEFGECIVQYVRVIETDMWRLYRRVTAEGARVSGDNWDKVAEGENTIGEIPLVNIYFNRKGFMKAEPCLESLAWLNLQHYQSSSDQNNILRFARTGTFFGSGFTSDEIKTEMTVGVDNMIKSSNPDAKLGVVEFSGAAIEAGSNDLKQIEDRMETLGHQPLIEPASLATGIVVNDKKTTTQAQAWVRNLENGILHAYNFAYKWYQQEIPEDFKVEIFSDFAADIQTDSSMEVVFKAHEKGIITDRTLGDELQRRDLISSKVDMEDEIELAQAEKDARMPAEFGINPMDDPDDDNPNNPPTDGGSGGE